MKKKFSTILLLAAVLCLAKEDNLQAQEEFQGSRSTSCTVSQSDLNNFVLGGRSTLDMILAQEKTEEYTIHTLSTGVDLELRIEYSFDTYKDYKEKTKKLLGYEPITTYGEAEVPYVENFSPRELFNFLDNSMQRAGVIEETSLHDMLNIEKDITQLNGNTYEGTGALNTSGEDEILFNSIRLDTELAEDAYTRTIEFSMQEEDAQRIFQVLGNRCDANNVELQEEGGNDCSVTFSSDSEQQLIKETMTILGTAVNIDHKKYYNTETSVRMETAEHIDVESLLNEEGYFSYTLKLPESYENLSADIKPLKEGEEGEGDKRSTSVSAGNVSSDSRKGEIVYYYDEPLQFDNISVCTDISNESYKIKRTITFYMDWNIADNYYKAVKKELEKNLYRGDALRIYDDQGFRCYEITYSSWSAGRIGDFTDRVFGINGSSLKIKRSAIPFVKSRIEDKFNISQGNTKDYSQSIDVKYILPGNTKATKDIEEGEEGKSISLTSTFDVSSDIKFSCFHYVKFVIYILGIIIAGIVVLFVISYIRGRFKKLVKRKTGKNSQGRYCPKCGAERQAGAVFCGKCGYRY